MPPAVIANSTAEDIAKYKAEAAESSKALADQSDTLHDMKKKQRDGREKVKHLQDELQNARNHQATKMLHMAALVAPVITESVEAEVLDSPAMDSPAQELGLLQLDSGPGDWPPIAEWVDGEVKSEASPRSKSYAAEWPGTKRQPAYPFKGNGAYDGGKSMRAWMKGYGVKPTQQMRLSAQRFDFHGLEKKLVGDTEDKRDKPGQWPPTNTWVKGDIVQEHDWLDPDAMADELADAGTGPVAQEDSGQWPPVNGWVEGAVETKVSPRSEAFSPVWPGANRAPAYPFKGNGAYDGGKSMRGWMKGYGVNPTQQMRRSASNFDFDNLENKLVGSTEQKKDKPGQWPPTNTWVNSASGTP